MCSMCYYFCSDGKFQLVSNFTELHALTQAACSYALLTNTIKKARPTLSTGNVVGGTLLSANVLKKCLQCMDSVSRQITTVNHTQKQGIITGTLPYRYSCSYIHGISTRDVHKLRCVHRVYTDWVVPHAKLIHCWTTVHTHLVKKDQPLYQKAFAVSPILRPRVHKNRQLE